MMTESGRAACLLRAVCDNLVVHMIEGERADFAFNPLPLIPESVWQWKAQLADWGEGTSLYPAKVMIGRYLFGLGTNYDEAVRADGVSAFFGMERFDSGCPLADLVCWVSGCDSLVPALFQQHAFCALDGNRELSEKMNDKACITVSSVFDSISGFAEKTGGFDFAIIRGEISEEVLEMAVLRNAPVFHLGAPDASGSSLVYELGDAGVDRILFDVCAEIRRIYAEV